MTSLHKNSEISKQILPVSIDRDFYVMLWLKSTQKIAADTLVYVSSVVAGKQLFERRRTERASR